MFILDAVFMVAFLVNVAAYLKLFLTKCTILPMLYHIIYCPNATIPDLLSKMFFAVPYRTVHFFSHLLLYSL